MAGRTTGRQGSVSRAIRTAITSGTCVIRPPDLPAVLLAGGLGRRMGGVDKCLVELAGQPLLDHVVARTRPQAGRLLLNANGDVSRFDHFGLELAVDPVGGFVGPLAGILAGMRWAAALGYPDVLSLPTDTPFFPLDLAARLSSGTVPETPVACAASGGVVHPVFALWPTGLADALEATLRAGHGSVRRFACSVGCTAVTWPSEPYDPFFNVNTPDDLALAEDLAKLVAGG